MTSDSAQKRCYRFIIQWFNLVSHTLGKSTSACRILLDLSCQKCLFQCLVQNGVDILNRLAGEISFFQKFVIEQLDRGGCNRLERNMTNHRFNMIVANTLICDVSLWFYRRFSVDFQPKIDPLREFHH